MIAASDAPPPAFVRYADQSRRMAQNSFCWGTRCVDYVSPDSRDDVPRITVAPGERLRFRLRFAPSEVAVILPRRTVKLHARKQPVWRVKGRPRWLILFARARGGGDSGYVVKVRVNR